MPDLVSLGALIATTVTLIASQAVGQAIAFTAPNEMFIHRLTSSFFLTSRRSKFNQVRNTIKRKNFFMSSSSSSPNKPNDEHRHNSSSPSSPLLFTYQLGKSVYIPLTSQCNSKTLPETRGGTAFLRSLPLDVIKSLIFVRVVECVTSDDSDNGMTFDGNEEELIHELKSQEQEIENEISSWVESLSANKDEDNVSIEERIIQNVLSKSCSKIKRNNKRGNNYDDHDHQDSMMIGPSVQTLFHDFQHRIKHTDENDIESIVFAGEGEPTLRLETILSLCKLIRSGNDNHKIPIRVLSNGLIYYQNCQSNENDTNDNGQISINNVMNRSKVIDQMKDAGVTSFSIALQTSCPIQYNDLMAPFLISSEQQNQHDPITTVATTNSNSNDSISYPHECVCNFIKDVIATGLDVEVTCVRRDFIDVEQVERLVKKELGVMKPIRWRSWF